MAAFGSAITEQTVKGLSYYRDQKEITQVDCAREAMRFIHSVDPDNKKKNQKAVDYAWDQRRKYGRGVSTMVLVYNATGARVTLEGGPNWYGYNFDLQPPRTILNGQWISFLHASGQGQGQEIGTGSVAARVFRGRDVNGQPRDFMVAWNITDTKGPTNAYTEIGDQNYFATRWDAVRRNLLQAKGITRAKDENCASTISIGAYHCSQCIVVLKHQFSPLPAELYKIDRSINDTN